MDGHIVMQEMNVCPPRTVIVSHGLPPTGHSFWSPVRPVHWASVGAGIEVEVSLPIGF